MLLNHILFQEDTLSERWAVNSVILPVETDMRQTLSSQKSSTSQKVGELLHCHHRVHPHTKPPGISEPQCRAAIYGEGDWRQFFIIPDQQASSNLTQARRTVANLQHHEDPTQNNTWSISFIMIAISYSKSISN